MFVDEGLHVFGWQIVPVGRRAAVCSPRLAAIICVVLGATLLVVDGWRDVYPMGSVDGKALLLHAESELAGGSRKWPDIDGVGKGHDVALWAAESSGGVAELLKFAFDIIE